MPCRYERTAGRVSQPVKAPSSIGPIVWWNAIRGEVSISSAVATPSASIYIASFPISADMRLVVKPGDSFTVIDALPIASIHCREASSVAKIGSAPACPVTNAHLVCRLLLEKKNKVHPKPLYCAMNKDKTTLD